MQNKSIDVKRGQSFSHRPTFDKSTRGAAQLLIDPFINTQAPCHKLASQQCP